MAALLLKQKLNKLKKALQSYKKVLVAYSGGVDSSFLLKCCSMYLGRAVLAGTAVSPTYTNKELKAAKQTARDLRVAHKIIHTAEVGNPQFSSNPPDRCYHCKKELFSKLKALAVKEDIRFILDGSNLDDLKDYRPGAKAKKEFGVRSPLAEASLNKEEIRKLSKEFGLKTWDAPAASCLASRFAYGQNITPQDLARIEKGEEYIRNLGIKMARLRHYRVSDGSLLARIEVEKKDISKVTSHKPQVTKKLKTLGYNYITLDLEGYRTGSMNEALRRR